MRLNEDETGKISDGLSELQANADSIFYFMQIHSASTIGMCSKADLEAFLEEFMKQRLASIPSE